MPAARTITTSFNAGELSPLMAGRVDQDKYFSGSAELSNFIPTVQGPARRRGGTRYVGATKTAANRIWIEEFIYSAGQAYILEFGDQYIRFFTNRGQLLDGGSPYEITSPYLLADLTTSEGTFALRTLQLGDVMWIVHAEGKYPWYKLSRLGATNWTLTVETPLNGPFRDLNVDDTVKVIASATTGSVTITASGAAIFDASQIGMLFYMESNDPSVVTPYQPFLATATNAQVRNGGNVYLAVTGATEPTEAERTKQQRYVPTHTEGEAYDGRIMWRYLHSGYGHGVITAVADGTHATMTVLKRLPDEVVAANGNQPGADPRTRRWAFGDLSAVYGWPTNISLWRDRVVLARGRKLYFSTVGDYTNFAAKDAGLLTEETAMILPLAVDKLDDIRWISPSRDLLVGSQRVEVAVREQTAQKVFSAGNTQPISQTEHGARMLRPLRVGNGVLMVERAGHRVREVQYSYEIERYKAEDITVLSEHLFDGSEIAGDAEQEPRQILDWTYQQQRDSIVWTVLSDGALAALVLNRERGVVAWTPHYIGGTDTVVEAVRSIPSPDGTTDDLWLIVRRTVNGSTRRDIEYMTDYRLVKQGAEEAYHVDGGITYRGTAATTITGLGHMNGETVQVCADGNAHPDRVVASGQITLDYAASLVHVGRQFISRMQSMRLEVQGGGGTSQTAIKGLSSVFLRTQSTIGGAYGTNLDEMYDIPTLDTYDVLGSPPRFIEGDIELNFGHFERDCRVIYEQSLPLPATLVAIILNVQING